MKNKLYYTVVHFILISILVCSCMGNQQVETTESSMEVGVSDADVDNEIPDLVDNEIQIELDTMAGALVGAQNPDFNPDISDQEPEELLRNVVRIYNNYHKSLSFKYGIDFNDMIVQTVAGQDTWLGPEMYDDSKLFVTMSTKGKIGKYALQRGTLYGIYWNTKKAMWELEKVRVE